MVHEKSDSRPRLFRGRQTRPTVAIYVARAENCLQLPATKLCEDCLSPVNVGSCGVRVDAASMRLETLGQDQCARQRLSHHRADAVLANMVDQRKRRHELSILGEVRNER